MKHPVRSQHCIPVGSVRRGGFVLVIVLGILLVLSVLGFSLYRSVSETSYVVYAHTYSMLLDQACLELSRVIAADVSAELQDPLSPLFQKVLQTPIARFPIPVSGRDTRWLKACAFYGKPDYENLSVAIDVAFVEPEPLTTTLVDPLEKRYSLKIALDLSMGKTSWRKLKKHLDVSYAGKIQRIVPGLLSKFTLLVREPEATDIDNPGYNCFENWIDGRATLSSPVRPVVLCHRTALQQRDVQVAGWVGFGGARELQLHLTSGGDTESGEFFQFYTLDQADKRPPLFTLQSIPTTSAFQSGISVSLTSPLKAQLGLQGALFGFYTVDNSNPPQDMNYNNTLERYFAAVKSRTMASSMLHLFGSMAKPSPTRVFGRVKRVFGQYTALVADLEPADGRNDAVVTMLKNPVQVVGGGGATPFWDSFAPISSLKIKGVSLPQDIPPITMEELFGNEILYRSVCSRLIVEDYNRAYDYLMDQTMQLPPAALYRGRFQQTQHRLNEAMLTTPDQRQMGPEDLERLSGERLLTNRISHVYETAEDFLADCVASGCLQLRGRSILVKNGPVTVPRNLKVVSSGLLAVRGELNLDGGLACESGVQLAMVSLGGSIRLKTTNEVVQAFLIALDGTVIPEGTFPVRVVGGVAVKTMKPADWRVGGSITWDERFDPCQAPDVTSYVAQFADHADRWELRSK